MEIDYLKKIERLSSGTRIVQEKEKAQVIYELRRKYKIIELIKVAWIARSTYYYYVRHFEKPDKYKHVKQEIAHLPR